MVGLVCLFTKLVGVVLNVAVLWVLSGLALGVPAIAPNSIIASVHAESIQGAVASTIAPERSLYAQVPLHYSNAQRWKVLLYEEVLHQGLAFADFKRLNKIAYCESRWRQFDKNGEVLRGLKHPLDIGIFQINTNELLTDHLSKSVELGYDLLTPEGNTMFAVWLYSEKGAQPWVCTGK